MRVSKLHFYSIGIVAVNKPLDSKVIEVTPIEELPLLDGDITDNMTTEEFGGEDSSGRKYKDKINSSVSIRATWLPISSSNRVTAPDVRRGETVMIYRFANTDEYWWATLKDDSNLRKLETAIFAFSATQDEQAVTGADNCYWLEISAHKKLVHFHTSQANGEVVSYDLQFNLQDGYFQIQDSLGNYFTLDSVNEHLVLSNKSGSVMEISKDILNLGSKSEVNINTKSYKLVAVDTQIETDTMKTTAQTSIDVSTKALTTTATDSTKLTTATLDQIATASTFKADTHQSTALVKQIGDVEVDGNEVVMGMCTLGGGMTMPPTNAAGVANSATMTGNLNLTGDLAITGMLTNNGHAVGSTHKHNVNLTTAQTDVPM